MTELQLIIIGDFCLFPLLYRLRARRRPFIAYYPGMTRDALAYYGCGELFQVPALSSEGMILSVEFCAPKFKP